MLQISLWLDARIAEGPITLARLSPSLATLAVAEGTLVGYVHYPGSDRLNGGMLRVADGPRLMERRYSHHAILLQGHWLTELRMLGRSYGLTFESVG